MRIEISAGGIGGSVLEFHSDMNTFLSDADSIISGFKAVKSSTCNLSGGVGNLQGALDEIDQRISAEEAAKEHANDVQTKSESFLQLAERIDMQVAGNVNRNKEALYDVNPWLRPSTATEDTPWYEEAWNWICDKGEQIVDGVKKAWEWTKDTAKKAWDGLVEFYNEHKKIIDTVLIVVGVIVSVVAVVASGGWALVPLLVNVFAIPASAAITISTVVAVAAVVTTISAGILNVVDVWAEIDNPFFNAAQNILNISSSILNITYSIGNLYNSFKGYRITNFEGKKVIQNDQSFDLTPENLERMRKKKAPIGKDGKAVELHHLRQTEDGGFIELTMKDHRGAGNYEFWHNTSKSYQSVVDHGSEWISYTKRYWNWRGNANFSIGDSVLKNISNVNIVSSFSNLFSGMLE